MDRSFTVSVKPSEEPLISLSIRPEVEGSAGSEHVEADCDAVSCVLDTMGLLRLEPDGVVLTERYLILFRVDRHFAVENEANLFVLVAVHW